MQVLTFLKFFIQIIRFITLKIPGSVSRNDVLGPLSERVKVQKIIATLFKQALNDINTKTLQFNKYCKGLPVKASKQQKSFWG